MEATITHKLAEKILEEGRGCIPELTKEDEDLLIKYHEEGMTIGHACMNECAYVMGIAPETVHLERLGIESGLSTHVADYFKEAGISIRDGGWDRNFPNRFSGHDPVGCNERIGKAILNYTVQKTAEAFKMIKDDTLCEAYLKQWLEKQK